MSQTPLGKMYAIVGLTGLLGQVQMGGLGDLFVGQRHSPLYEGARAGAQMIGGNQAGATLSAALATTYTGLCLSNPAGSGVDLSLQSVKGAINVAPAALTTIGLIAGYSAAGVITHTTALTPLNGFLNGAAPKAKLDAACTIVGTPAWVRWLSETPTATGVMSWSDDVQGAILIPPGGYVAVGATIAGPAAGLLASFTWEEVPLAD